MIKRICKFCQKDMVYVPLSIKFKSRSLGATSLGPKQFEVYYCYDCSYEYVLLGSGLENHHLYVTINNRMYRWSVEDNGKLARLWYIGEPGIPGVRANQKLSHIKSFKEYFPQLTPQNVEKKLRFILLFL